MPGMVKATGSRSCSQAARVGISGAAGHPPRLRPRVFLTRMDCWSDLLRAAGLAAGALFALLFGLGLPLLLPCPPCFRPCLPALSPLPLLSLLWPWAVWSVCPRPPWNSWSSWAFAAGGVDDDELHLPAGEVDLGDADGEGVADLDGLARALGDQGAGGVVELVAFVAGAGQLGDGDEAVDEVAVDLDEHAASDDAADGAGEVLAELGRHELEHEVLPQLALGLLAVALGLRAVPALLHELVEVGHAVVVHQRLGDPLGLLLGGDALELELGRGVEVRVDRAVHDEVGVPADRAGEVRVVLAGQREVPDGLRGVLGLGQRAEHGDVHRVLRRLAADRVEQLLQLLSARPHRDVVAGDAGELPQLADVVGVGVGVDAADHRHVEPGEEPGRRLVRLDHEHLDDRVGERVVLGLGVDTRPASSKTRFTSGSPARSCRGRAGGRGWSWPARSCA